MSVESVADKVLGVVEDVIYAAIALLLVVGAGALLFNAGRGLLKIGDAGVDTTVLNVLDTVLLVFILVELLFAVRSTLVNQRIVAEPFLLVGVLAAIKEIVVLSVSAANEYIGDGPKFARAMVEIGVLTGTVVALGITILLLRRNSAVQQEQEERSADADVPG